MRLRMLNIVGQHGSHAQCTTTCTYQRWPWMRSAGVGWHLGLSFRPG